MRRGVSEVLESLRQRLRKPVNYIFNEDLMALLAFLIIPTVIFPYLFTFSPAMLDLFEALNYLIIAAFVAEYGLKLFVAEDRLAFVRSPWHVLDLVIIALAFAEFLPFVAASAGRASPLLRLLRGLRAATAAGRTVRIPVKAAEPAPAAPKASAMKVSVLGGDGAVARCTVDDPACQLVAGSRRWIDLQDVGEVDLEAISRALNVPRHLLESRIIQETFPRIDYLPGLTTIFLWDAELDPAGARAPELGIRRHGMLIVCANSHLVTICTGEHRQFDEIAREVAGGGEDFAVRVLLAVLRRRIRDAEEIVHEIERRTALLETLPPGKAPPSFLEDTFLMRRGIQMAHKNLWHLRQVFGRLKTRRVALDGIREEHVAAFEMMYDEVDSLYENTGNINDSLASLRELHLNTTTYEMTRVMRLIAVLTCLALIPTIAGGLLGTNLVDVPFPVTLPEIGLVVGGLMLIALYAFYKMGWLR